jgi:hypothetical protein
MVITEDIREEMLDCIDGVRSIDQVFADIDAQWAALRANSASPPTDG